MAKDILLADSIDLVEELMLEDPQDDGVLRIEPIERPRLALAFMRRWS